MTTITHEYNLYDKQRFLDTLNKIVKRYKARVDLVWGEPVTQKTEIGGHSPWSGEFISNKVNLLFHPVTVNFDFDEFKIDGYTYLGCIKDETMMGLITIHGNDALEGRDVNDFVKSFDDIPCHHCERKHRRKVGHLFLHNDTNEVMVFGSSCAKNFFGINFDRLLKFFERINSSFGEGWDDDFVRGYRDKTIHWQSAARFAYYWISKNGYLSATKARNQGMMSTGNWVQEIYAGNDDVLTKKVKNELSEMDYPEMDILHTAQYVKDPDNPNDFEYNLLVLQEKMRLEAVERTNFGWIAFMVYNQFFKHENKTKKIDYIIPEWAIKGHRYTDGLEATVTHIHEFEGSYGLTRIYTFVSDNLRFKWFTSTNQHVDVDDVVTMKAFTVKITEDNQYGKSVMVNRVVLVKDGEPTRPRKTNPTPQTPRVSKADLDYFERMGIPTK